MREKCLAALMLLLLSSSVHCGRWCGSIRFALGHSLGYSIATAPEILVYTVNTSAQVHINTRTGDVYCECLYLQETDVAVLQELVVEISIPIVSFHNREDQTVTVNFAHPCLIASCEHGMPLQPSTFTAPVQLQAPLCVRHLFAVHKQEESLTIETRPQSRLALSQCRTEDYAKLLVSSVIRVKERGPVLVLMEAFPLHLMSCAAGGHPQPLSLRLSLSSPLFPPSNLLLIRLPRQSGGLEFESLHNIEEVMENSPLGTFVTTVQASDPDQDRLTYSMTSSDISNQELFSINSQSGVVTTSGYLDRETAEEYVFTVTAEDDGGETTSAIYTFKILDENDNSPTFQSSTFHTLAIPEDQQVGSTLLDLRVVDEDAGNNALVSYQLLNNTGELFGVVASGPSGQQALLNLMRGLDHEVLTYFLLTLVAMDGGSPSHTSSAIIEIIVLDIADNPPQFNATSYSAVVPEDSSVGLHILTVHATTPDSPQVASITYYIVGGDPTIMFHLDPNTGELTLFQSLDFEATELYALTVQAQSGPGASLRTTVTVMVKVANVNDNEPTYSRTQYTISISESAAVGQHVIGVSAGDLDSGEFGEVTYQIVSSDASVLETFDLDPSSGSIRTRRALDQEQQDTFEFSVVAEDGGEPPLTGSILVVVRVEDVNDQPPVFAAMCYEASILENATSGTIVVTVEATDSDSETIFLEYFLQAGNVQGRFFLDRTLGSLSTHGTLDHEVTAIYNLTVVASDGQLESSVQVIVTVTDVNDCYPIFPTNFYVIPALSESLPTGTEVLLAEAVDQDTGSNGQVSYSSSDLPPQFLLDPSSGAITLHQALDYETNRYHSFNIIASDLGTPSLSSTAHVEITVRDENDNRPEFLSSQQFGSVPENSAPHTSVLQLVASDADSGSNAILSYSIIADTTAMQAFSIDGLGVIHTQRELDREVRELYQLTVEVRDHGKEPLAATTGLEVMILDEIDYSPVFTQVTYDVHLTELTPPDTVVVNVSATTLDSVGSAILYIITGGQNRSLFRIDQSTGAVSTATTLDPQLQSGVYKLTVTALHHDLSESVPVFITLAVEDGTPRLAPLSLYLNTFASLLPDKAWRLGTVQVLQRKAQLQYTFALQPSSSRIHRYFTIDSMLGEISAAGGTPSGYYALNVSVSVSTATGYGLVEVYVHVLTNATLESAVVAAFGDSSEIGFASIHLERFAHFLLDIVPCTRQQVEIFGIQARPSEPSIVDVAFAIRTSDLQNYFSPETILGRLLANLSSARPTLLEFTTDACVGDPCPNLLQCRPVVQLYPQVPSKVLKATGLLYLSHAFAQAFTCTCPQGYSREGLCNSEINECASTPCHFGAACEDLIGDYRCACPQYTLGKNCSVVCPSHSCQPCASSPCLHDSSCRESEEGTYSCDSCPWDEDYRGPNCELTSLHFTPGGFAAYPPLGSVARINISFSFATVTPTGVLVYNGPIGGSHDYIAAELVIGQLQVGVSLGGSTVILKTDSSQLNDGQWHSVLIQLDLQGLTVQVGGCSSEPQYIQGAEKSCLLWAPLRDTGARTLDVNGPLYIGGVEAHHMPLPLAISTFVGCLSHLALDGTLVDLATPTKNYGVEEGCPPLGTKCSLGRCARGECVPVWNGTLCNCEGDIPLCQNSGSSVHLSNGFLQLQEEGSTTTIEHFSMALRTHRTSAVLVQFGSSAALEIRHGSLVYRRSQTDSNTALTLAADAFISDGLWHRVELRTETFSTTPPICPMSLQLSVDDERVSCSRPEGGRVSVNSIILGAQDPTSANDRLSGCLGSLILNIQPLDLARALSDSSLSQYSISSSNASVGCGNGDPCVGVACPAYSTCEPDWQEYSCACDSGFLLEGGSCVDPCVPNPCMNGGSCIISVSLGTRAVFHCQCKPPHQGPTCEEVDDSCPEGFGPTPTCQRCLCAPEGVEDGVCDRTAQCLCKDDLLLFSPSGDLGCQSCDCHTLSSTSPNCDASSGQCDCVPNVEGRRCDKCAEGYAGLDEQGCKRAEVITGSFSLAGVAYTNALVASSPLLALGLRVALEGALTSFGLPGFQEVAITAVSNSSGYAGMLYQVSAYLPRDPSPLLLPSTHTLAAVMQSLVQSGWVGSYQTVTDSHLLLMNCDADPCDPRAQCHLDSTLPFVCGPCPGGTLDGLICRAELPQGCSGVDSDGDALPDTCDNCPYVFNPGQDKDACAQLEGVCPAGVASGVLWSPTAAGSIDRKPCFPPLTGSAVRHCEEGGTWGEVNTAGCVSVLGQQLLAEISAITGGWLPTEEQLLFSLAQLEAFSSGTALSAEDVRVAAMLLMELVDVWVVLVEGGVTSSALEDLASSASSLLDPRLHPQWVGVAVMGVAAEDLLQAVEQMASTASTKLPSPLIIDREHLRIETVALEDSEELVFTSASSGQNSRVDVPLLNFSLSRSLLAVTYLPTIGQLLPQRHNFTTPTGVNLTVAGPVISVQVGGADHTPLVTPITLTWGHNRELVSYEDSDAICVFWKYGESGGWSQEGCWLVALNATHTICQCSHLTAFAVLLPEDTFQVSGCAFPECYRPAVFTYIVLGVTSVPLLATWLVLAWISSIQDLQTTVHKHQMAALTLTGLVFMVGVGRTEVEGVCAVLTVVFNFLLLADLCWLLAGGILVAHILLTPQPKTKFAMYLYIIGWAMPLLLCGIPVGVIGIISDSFVMDLGHPYYCWFAPEVVWVFVGPALLLVMVVVVSLVVVGWLLGRPRAGGDPSTSRVGVIIGRDRAKVSLCVLGVLLVLLVFTWGFGLLAVYGQTFQSPLPELFESIFAILYATMGGFVFIIFCLNSKVREACWSKLCHKDESSSLQATLGDSSILDRFNYQSSHHGRSRGDHMAFHNTLSMLPPASSFTPNSTLTTQVEDDLSKSLSLRTAPLPSSSSPTPPPLPPPLTQSTTLNSTATSQQQQPWFIIPEATPLSPLPYGSDADISSEFSERPSLAGDGDDISATISELYQQARGQESLEGYLECPGKQLSSPQGTEDPLWYRQRDSISQIEVVPMPYETAVKPPLSPQRSVQWRDLEETGGHPDSGARRPGEHSPCSTKAPSSIHNSQQVPEQSQVTEPSPEAPCEIGLSNALPERMVGPLSGWPHEMTGNGHMNLPHSDLQRPHPLVTPHHSRVPGMSRTVSDKLPPHPHIHCRTSAAAQHTANHFPPSQVSFASSHLPLTLQSQTGATGSLSFMGTSGSKTSVERMGDGYHSNGPSTEGYLNQVIRHADGSETHQSLV